MKKNLIIQRETSKFFSYRTFSINVDGLHAAYIKDNESLELDIPVGKHEILITCGIKKAKIFYVNVPKDEMIFLKIINKPVSKLRSWSALMFWALCLAVGAIISPSIGAGFGFAVGYFVRSQLINNLAVSEKGVGPKAPIKTGKG